MSESSKRPSESEISGVSKRRKPLDELSEDGPLTQKDVVYFQKEAIWRQMNTYKKQCSLLSKDLLSFKHKYEVNELKLNILDIWYEQIVNAFSVEEKGDVNENLLLKITNHSERDKLDDILNKRRKHLLSILSPIISKTKTEYPNDKGLLERFEKLNLELCEIKAKNETVLKFKVGLEETIHELKDKILDLSKENDRIKSKTLNRIDPTKSSIQQDVKKEEENFSTSVLQNESSSSTPTSTPIIDSEIVIKKEELETLKLKLKEYESLNSTIENQLNDTIKKYQKSSEDCLELASRLSSLSSKDLQASPIYQNLVSQNKKLNEQIDELNKIQSILNLRLNELENLKSNYKKLIEETSNFETENLKQQLNKCENDLVRIRTSRDELLLKNTILKSQIENKSIIEELEKLIKVQDTRISNLTKDKQKEQQSVQEDVDKFSALPKEDLIKRILMLNNEIKEIESAFQQTHEISIKKLNNEIENDLIIKKIQVEKTKADQKYFAAMRSKDSLISENKVLKSQISKSQEVVGKLNEIEKTYLAKIELLRKSESDYKLIKENSIQENSKLQEHLKSLQASKEKSQIEIRNITKTLEAKSNELKEVETERNHLLQKSSKLEAKSKELDNLVKKYRANNTSSILQDDEQQLEALRSIAKCSLCSKNWKDTAITVCGHVFCSDCAQERLAARLRRCPSCNKGFSANDLLSIHL